MYNLLRKIEFSFTTESTRRFSIHSRIKIVKPFKIFYVSVGDFSPKAAVDCMRVCGTPDTFIVKENDIFMVFVVWFNGGIIFKMLNQI